MARKALREIGCNNAAQKLESKKRARLDKGKPTFRKTSSGDSTDEEKELLVSAKDTVRRNKTSIQRILSGDYTLILNKVYEHGLITEREYKNLKSINKGNVEGHVVELVDTIMDKGEDKCQQFLDLLETDEDIKETLPELKTIRLNYGPFQSEPMQTTSSTNNRESRNRARLDGNPTFRKTSSGDVDASKSLEARSVAAKRKASQEIIIRIKTLKEVEAEAAETLKSEGGDPSDRRQLLSRFTLQFGQYVGKSFKWLLENDLGYVGYLLGSHQEDHGTRTDSAHMDNKDALEEYATRYPEVIEEISFYHKGQTLMGFGRYKKMTRQALYDSTDEEHKGYVSFLRGNESSCTRGSPMEEAIIYILHRDRARPASGVTRASSSRPKKRQPKRRGPPAKKPKPAAKSRY